MNPSPGRSIIVQTYDGFSVSNSVDCDPSPMMIEEQKRSMRRGGLILAGPRVLGPPSGRYNCHGLVFASRRANIPAAGVFDNDTIDNLLQRDIYKLVNGLPQTGDIIVYRHASGEIEHTALVSRVESVGAVAKVFAWSKWGALEEFEHLEETCPYRDCKIEYWRLRR